MHLTKPSFLSTVRHSSAFKVRYGSSISNDKRKVDRVLSGIQPTGIPHLGNYLGALQQWVQLQSNPGQEHFFMIADLHSITVCQNPKRLPGNVASLAMALLAIGINPEKSVIFRQSRIPQHTELAWILFCRTPISWLKRMHHWKSKLLQSNQAEDNEEEHLNVGLLSYPVLQAADILLYRATQVPVGEDQAQHLNLASAIAKSFNSHYKSSVFPLPKSLLVSTEGKRIMSLKTPTSKMSKSDPAEGSRILLSDSDDQIASKIRKATMDSIMGITYDVEQRPGVANLLHIMSCINGNPPSEIARACANDSNQRFKERVTEEVINLLRPIRNELLRLEKDMDFVYKTLKDGEEKAQMNATKTMEHVKRVVGL